jgi:hypothetical protein
MVVAMHHSQEPRRSGVAGVADEAMSKALHQAIYLTATERQTDNIAN